jgi:multidrug efflux pump subunit AcrA (membrane-fusion protein)
LLLVAIATWFGVRYWTSDSEENFTTGEVVRRDIVQRVTISGLIVPVRTATLSAPYAGYIRKIFVNIGQKVKRGEPVVSVTQTPDGDGENVFPLRAPFDGMVMQILKTEGADVKDATQADAGLVRIDDTSKLYIESDTPEMDFPKLKIGQHAIVKASSLPEKTYDGEILSLFQAAKSQDRWDRSRVEFPIRVVVTNKDDALKPGMSVTMDIITAEARDVLALRHDFVGKGEKGYFVLDKNGKPKDIKVGMRSEDAFEIVSGVNEGDQVMQVDFLASESAPASSRRSRRRH